jgi:hypothetical protein
MKGILINVKQLAELELVGQKEVAGDTNTPHVTLSKMKPILNDLESNFGRRALESQRVTS